MTYIIEGVFLIILWNSLLVAKKRNKFQEGTKFGLGITLFSGLSYMLSAGYHLLSLSNMYGVLEYIAIVIYVIENISFVLYLKNR